MNCIIDSVRAIFLHSTDTSVLVTNVDTLNIGSLSGHPLNAGYDASGYCSNRIIIPRQIGYTNAVAYSCIQCPINSSTGEINPSGIADSSLIINLTSDYCLVSNSQIIRILSAPDTTLLPREMKICENSIVY